MFELISGGPRHPFHEKTATPVVLSVALHAVVLTVVVIVPLLYATNSLPKVPTMMAFVADAPVASPPPPPPTITRLAGEPPGHLADIEHVRTSLAPPPEFAFAVLQGLPSRL